MNRTQSLFLDALRGLAAVAVVFHHYNGHIFNVTSDMPNGSVFPNIGQEAVVVFFVLSGFIISHVAQHKENTFSLFIAKRLSRLYSVMIPVVALAIILFFITSKIDPGVYDLPNKGDLTHPLKKIGSTLLFLNHNFLFDVDLPACGPFWSLICEWWYYVFFAIFYFLGDRMLFVLLAFVSGFDAFSLALWFAVYLSEYPVHGAPFLFSWNLFRILLDNRGFAGDVHFWGNANSWRCQQLADGGFI